MQTSIRSIGNSQGIYIPKTVLEELHWSATEPLDMKIENNTLVLQRNTSKSLRQRFEEFYKKPFEEISESEIPEGYELDWGPDIGGEIL